MFGFQVDENDVFFGDYGICIRAVNRPAAVFQSEH